MESPIAAQAIFVGRRGNFTLQGEFQGEPDWERLAEEEGGSLLREVRDCHLPSSQPPRDWVSLGGEICLPSHEPTESFGLGEVRRVQRTWFQEFVLLPLGSEQALLGFARQRGIPAELPKIHGDLRLFCPVLRFQYDLSVLRALLRVAGELRRPEPDEATLDVQVRLLQRLWQDPRRSWISVGDKTDSDYPDYPSEEPLPDQQGGRDSFPLYLQTWVLQEQRTGAPSPILESDRGHWDRVLARPQQLLPHRRCLA